MFQTIGKLMLILPLLFCGAITAIHAQAPTDGDVGRFLLPSLDCATPCWQGIQPGVTTADQALALLNANPWVGGVDGSWTRAPSGIRVYSNVYWGWSGAQPAFVYNNFALSPPYLHVRGGIVQYIRIPTNISYGTARSIMGAPGTRTLSVSIPNARPLRYEHDAEYFGGQLSLDSEINCPVNPYAFWNAPVVVTYGDGSTGFNALPPYDLARQLYHQPCNA
jgi:hypothetical protein